MNKLFIIPVLLIAVSLSADDRRSFRDKQINFIKELYESGRYFDCIGETRKLQFTEKIDSVEYFIFSNYFLSGQYETVINNFYIDSSTSEIKFQSLLLLSGSFLNKGMYYESYKILKKSDYSDIPDKYLFTMFLRRIEPLILSGETERIEDELTESRIFLEDNYNFIKLREELQLYSGEGLKSPAYAALMSSFVPGLGQCYAGYPGEGIISLLSVAATAAGGFYLKDKEKRGFSYSLFFLSGLFYGGNIYGAYNSTENVNNEVLRKRHKNLISDFGSYNPGDYINIESVFN